MKQKKRLMTSEMPRMCHPHGIPCKITKGAYVPSEGVGHICKISSAMQYTRHAAASWVGFCLYGDGVAYPFPEGRASLLVCQMNCALKIEKLCNHNLLSISKPHKSKV